MSSQDWLNFLKLYMSEKDAKHTLWLINISICKMLSCHRCLFVVVIPRLNTKWNLQVYSHESAILRGKGQVILLCTGKITGFHNMNIKTLCDPLCCSASDML